MRVVTFQMPHLFDANIGIHYCIDSEQKLNKIVGAANDRAGALSVVDILLIQQGIPLDHSELYLDLLEYEMSIEEAYFEKTLLLLQSIGLSSCEIENNKIKIYAVFAATIGKERLKIRKDCPKIKFIEI